MHEPFMSVQPILLRWVVGIVLSVPEPEVIEQIHPVDPVDILRMRHVPRDRAGHLSQGPAQMWLQRRQSRAKQCVEATAMLARRNELALARLAVRHSGTKRFGVRASRTRRFTAAQDRRQRGSCGRFRPHVRHVEGAEEFGYKPRRLAARRGRTYCALRPPETREEVEALHGCVEGLSGQAAQR